MERTSFEPDALRYTPRMFADRSEAGRLLAQALIAYAGTDPLVLGLPRGGVPVADEIVQVLGGELDVWLVRKLGAPGQPELGIGAIAEGPAVVLDRAIVRGLAIERAELFAIAHREMAEIERRIAHFRGDRPVPDVRGRTVILVDDGIATGGTMRAAIRGVTRRGAGHVVVAAPVAAAPTCEQLRRDADELVCLHEADGMLAIGLWYEDFRQVHDEQVARILEHAHAAPS
jgi:putative phosphoribosyl transferase